jgi:hypothetical protein
MNKVIAIPHMGNFDNDTLFFEKANQSGSSFPMIYSNSQ